MLELITPEKYLSIDESMMLWHVRLIFRQDIQNKRYKYGIKFYEFCIHDGLVSSAEIYGGQGFNDVNYCTEVDGTQFGERISRIH